MWIFTQTGFVSAVRNKYDSEQLLVRSRDRVSLEPLALYADEAITPSPEGDYPYRLSVRDDVFGQWLDIQLAELDYENFKSRVSKTRGPEYAHHLMDVWSAMLETEDEEAHQ
ncbi:MAG: hypothetical protein ACKOWJ_00955 [Micrococcales bacterium]